MFIFSLAIQILLLILLNSAGAVNNFTVSIVILLTTIYLVVYVNIFHKENKIIILAYLLRVILLYIDRFSSLSIFGSGGDSEGFYFMIEKIYESPILLTKNVYGGSYVKILGLLSLVISPNRLYFQYLNVFLFTLTIAYVEKSIARLSINSKTSNYILKTLSFSPIFLSLNVVLLRESMIVFLITISFINMISFAKTRSIIFFYVSIVTLFFAAVFHTGMIGFLPGYLYIYYKLYLQQKSTNPNIIKNGVKIVSSIIFSLIIIYFLFNKFGDTIFQKFNRIETVYDLVDYSFEGGGGSQYLTNINFTNPMQILLQLPLKIFLFLFSPIPHQWRGIKDVLTFMADSLFFIFIAFKLLGKRKVIKENNLFLGFLISIVGFLVMFSIGVNNVGTAVRHRNKILSVLLIYWGIVNEENIGSEDKLI